MNELRERINTLRRERKQIVLDLSAAYKSKLEEVELITADDNSAKERKEKLIEEAGEIEEFLIEIVGIEESENITIQIEESLKQD